MNSTLNQNLWEKPGHSGDAGRSQAEVQGWRRGKDGGAAGLGDWRGRRWMNGGDGAQRKGRWKGGDGCRELGGSRGREGRGLRVAYGMWRLWEREAPFVGSEILIWEFPFGRSGCGCGLGYAYVGDFFIYIYIY